MSIHGSAFEFVRNQAVNATNFFAPIVNGRSSGRAEAQSVRRDPRRAGMDPEGLQRPRQDVLLLLVPGHPPASGAHPGTDHRADRRDARRAISPRCTKSLKDPFTGGECTRTTRSRPLTSARSASRSCSTSRCPRAATRRSPPRRTTSTRTSGWFAAISKSAAATGSPRAGSDPSANTPAYLDPGNYLAQNTGRTWLNRASASPTPRLSAPTFMNQLLFSFNRTDGNNIPIYPRQVVSRPRHQHLYRQQAAVVRRGHRLLGHAQHGRHQPLPSR